MIIAVIGSTGGLADLLNMYKEYKTVTLALSLKWESRKSYDL
jgi:hypothetical protein